MKITQSELIKHSLIKFYLDQDKNDGPHKPHPDLVELLKQESFKEGLVITSLKRHQIGRAHV